MTVHDMHRSHSMRIYEGQLGQDVSEHHSEQGVDTVGRGPGTVGAVGTWKPPSSAPKLARVLIGIAVRYGKTDAVL